MTSPVPGFAAPNPRTWSGNDFITAARLRGDVTNLGDLFTAARPVYWAQDFSNTTTGAALTLLQWTFVNIDSWGAGQLPATPGATPYKPPLAGWYLVTGNVGGTSANTSMRLTAGTESVINGNTAVDINNGSLQNGSGTNPDGIQPAVGELFQFNPATNDTVSMYVNPSVAVTLTSNNNFFVEWVALPTSGLTSYTGPYGTVIASPVFAAPFPPGPGTTLASPAAVGATSITVASNTGMITGGVLGLDFINGQYYRNIAEQVTITSVVGTTIGISATAYPHVSGAPVAVPIAPQFLNQQVRDAVNFLAYPPFCRLQCSSTQSIPSTAFPPTVGGNPGNQIVNFTPGGVIGQPNADNFSATSTTAFTAPVAGLYFVYGLVFLGSAAGSYSVAAGISVNAGTIQWGEMAQFTANVIQGPVVQRMVRLTAGQTVTLWAFQNSGGALTTNATTANSSRLICLWRAQ